MSEIKPLRVLIADDEPLATERLQLLLAKAEGAQLVGAASDGESRDQPDRGLSIPICFCSTSPCPVWTELASQERSPTEPITRGCLRDRVRPICGGRFEVEAVDYLMKPVDPNRLQRALDRARSYLEQRSEPSLMRGSAVPMA